MAATVPFALLGVVQLTAVAGWLALAAATALPALRRRTGWVVALGALCLAAADAAVPVQFGTPSSDTVGYLRVAGLGLIAVGALTAGTTARRRYLDPRGVWAGIVTPLGAAPTPSYLAAVLGVVAAGATLVRGRDRSRGEASGDARGPVVGAPDPWVAGWLSIGLLFTAAAAGLSESAATSTDAALAQLAARAAATVAVA